MDWQRFIIWFTERVKDREHPRDSMTRAAMGLGSWLILGLVLVGFVFGVYLLRDYKWSRDVETALEIGWAETVYVGPAGTRTALSGEEQDRLTQYLEQLTHSDSQSGNFNAYLGETRIYIYLYGSNRYEEIVLSENGYLQCRVDGDFHLFSGGEAFYQYLYGICLQG